MFVGAAAARFLWNLREALDDDGVARTYALRVGVAGSS
jgi:hypothetical protein